MAIITITRGVQSGGRKLAHQLADSLGYTCLSREVIAMCAKKYNIMEEELYHKLIEAPSRWRKLSKEHVRCLLYIQCSLIDAAIQDNVVYHGYAGQLFLQGVSHALKIRLEAPLVDRVHAEMAEYGKSYDEALEYINTADERRNRWVKFLYNQDWYDPALYDLSINLRNISIDSVCDMVALLVKSRRFATTKDSVRRLHELSLECEVKAAIASDDKLWDQPISARAEGTVVTLHGPVKNQKSRDAVIEVASQVKGVSECIDQMHNSSDTLTRGMYSGGHD